MWNKFLLKITGYVTVFAVAISLATPAGAFFIEVPKSVKDGLTKIRQLAQVDQSIPQQSDVPQQPVGQETTKQFQPIPKQNEPTVGDDKQQQNRFEPKQTEQNNQDNMGQGQQNQQPQLDNMKQNLKPMEKNLNRFEKMMQNNEKKGQKSNPEDQQKLERVKNQLDSIKNSTTTDELQNVDINQMNDDVNGLDQSRQQMEQEQRQVNDMKRNMKGAEQGLNMFEKQVNQLAKKKITVPQELKDTLQKIKTIISAVKNAKTMDEITAAGIDDLQDLMMSLDEYRQQMEMLSRWPQTLKQINQQIKNLDNQFKKNQTLVVKLSKKGIDLSVQLTEYKDAIDKLKSVRSEAITKVASGNSDDIQEAFDLLENDFFGQMDDVMQYQNIIQTMSNLGRFQSDFKRGIANAQQQIIMLKRKKIDTGELATILNDTNIKGNEILGMIKKPTSEFDEDMVMSVLQEMEDLRQQFGDKMDELTGTDQNSDMPWEQGSQQINSPMQSFNGVIKLIPKLPQQTNTQQESLLPSKLGNS